MSASQRRKGADVERAIKHLHEDAGIACEKVSRTGHPGPDLRVADTWDAECKARKDGAKFKTLERWKGDASLLFLKRDRQPPLVVLDWPLYVALLTAYLREDET